MQGSHRRKEGSRPWPEAPKVHSASHSTGLYTVAQGTALTSPWCGFGLRRPADLRHNEGVFALTAGEHDVVAGVAQVGVRLTRVALSPHTESQATAVTALLEGNPPSLPTPQPLKARLPSPQTMSPGGSLRGPQGAAWGQTQGGTGNWDEFILGLFILSLYVLPESRGGHLSPILMSRSK